MPVVPKEILAPGTFFPASGPVVFTDADLDHLCQVSNRMLASGRMIPIPLEHRDDATPVLLSHDDRLSQQTLSNTGWAVKFYRKGPSLWADLDIRDPQVADKVQNGLIRFVSPEIRSVYPADGVTYRNVITHVALTNKPVWKDQSPFHVPPGWVGNDGAVEVLPASARLSLAGSLRLSLEDSSPPEEVLRAARYRIPSQGLYVFGGRAYEGVVPMEALASASPQERQSLLRGLARRDRRASRATRDLVRDVTADSNDLPPEKLPRPRASLVSAHHFVIPHPESVPFHRPYQPGEPLPIWQDDQGVYLVAGHDAVAPHIDTLVRMSQSTTVPVVPVQGARTLQEANAIVLLSHVLTGTAHPRDLAEFFQETGATAKELIQALNEAGWPPHPDDEAALRQAEEAKDEARQESPPPGDITPEAVPALGEGELASPHPGGEGPRDGADRVGETVQLSHAEKPIMPDDVKNPFADDEGQETPEAESKEHGGKETPSPASAGPSPKEGEMTIDKALPEVVDDLREFNVHLPHDSYDATDLETFVVDLAKALKTLRQYIENNPEGEGAAMPPMTGTSPAAGGGGGGGKPPLAEEQPMTGALAMSLENKVREQEHKIQRLSLELDHTKQRAATAESRTLCQKIDELVTEGRCSKAQADDLKSKVEKCRLSLVDAKPSNEVTMVLTAINYLAQNPKGTYRDPTTTETTPASRLSLAETTNRHPTRAPDANGDLADSDVERIMNEFRRNVGLATTNGASRS